MRAWRRLKENEPASIYNSMTGMFIDKRMAAKHGFKLQKLERPIMVRNVNGTNNSRGVTNFIWPYLH